MLGAHKLLLLVTLCAIERAVLKCSSHQYGRYAQAGGVTGERLAIGGISGAVAQGTIYPMEVIQTRLAISPVGTYSGILDAFAKIVRQEGYFALFRWALDMASASVWLGTFTHKGRA